jgi:RES domain-containing protein
MQAWRLARRPYAALDGEGARLHGGRWNSPGRPLVYLASHLSLAVLEVCVNLDLPPELFPNDHVAIAVEIPDGLARERVAWAEVDPAGPAPGRPARPGSPPGARRSWWCRPSSCRSRTIFS